MILRITLWPPARLVAQALTRLRYWLAVSLLLFGQEAGAQTWQQAVVSAGTTGEYRVAATAADAAGNVYIAGTFSGTVRFGSSVLATPSTTFGTNAFVAKWSNSTQAFAWAQQVGGTGSDYATAIAVQGNAVYLAGYFYSSTASFGTINLSNAGSFTSDVFVAKLLDAGPSASFTWAQRAGGSGSEVEAGLSVNGTSLYVAGSFVGQAGFGATMLTSVGANDIFVAKLTDAGSTGSFSWAQAAGGASTDVAYALAAQGGNVYITGYFLGPTASFGPATIANASTPSTYDVYVAKLVDTGSSGSFVWAQQAGGTARDIGYAVAVSGTSVYIAGVFEAPTASFGGLTLTATTTTNTDAFLAKLTDAGSTGSFAWVRQVSGPGYELPMALAANGPVVYLAGYFGGPTATFGSTTLTTLGSNDIFLAKLTDAGSTGSYGWVQQAGGVGNDYLSSMVVLGANVYVGGSLTLPASFGSQQVSGPSITTSSFTGYWAQLIDTLQPLATTLPTASEPTLSLYPNPAPAGATVRIAAPVGTTQATLTVLGATGQVIRAQQVAFPATEPVVTLSLSGLTPGLYQLQVRADSWYTSKKLLVK